MRSRFACSYNRIELVITYVCNMACINCDAMVPQAVSKDKMSLKQVQKFVDESIQKKIHWRHIRILGGEPTLHRDIFAIVDLLIHYKKNYSPDTRIQLVTNGHGKAVQKILAKIPTEIEIENSQKISNVQPTFSPINQAPVDLEEYKNSDFSKGCWIPTLCGMTLDPHGYYPCSAAAAIDRVFGGDVGKKELPVHKGELEDMLSEFCKLCGHYYDKINELAEGDILSENQVLQFEEFHKKHFAKTQENNSLTESVVSDTWKKALKNYKEKRPALTEY